MSSLGTFVPFILIIAVFWLFIIRPQQRRAQEARSMQSELAVGSEVMLTSGIYGTITELTDDVVRVEIADGVSIRITRAAIGRVVLPESADSSESINNAQQTPETGTEIESGDVAGPEENN